LAPTFDIDFKLNYIRNALVFDDYTIVDISLVKLLYTLHSVN